MMRNCVSSATRRSLRSSQVWLTTARSVSSSSGSGATGGQQTFPFPDHVKSPTPFQIFHLPPTASPTDIKSRYYELVRSHHPDCAACRSLPRAVAHARFQAITHAYEVLTGKRKPGRGQPTRAESAELARRRAAYRAAYASGRPYTGGRNEWGGFEYPDSEAYRAKYHKGDITGSQTFYVAISVMTVVLALLHVTHVSPLFYSNPTSTVIAVDKRHDAARLALEQARLRGQEYGDERREGIRRWVKEAGLEGVGRTIGRGGRRKEPEDL